MEKQFLQQELEKFQKHLNEEEKSEATIEKYIRDESAFLRYAGNRDPEKNLVIEYKQNLIHEGYRVRSINSMLASLNSFFDFSERPDCKVKALKLQKEIYRPEEKELTKE